MKKVRVANPGPAGLLVINPKRGNSMATKRRRSAAAASSRRKTTRRKSNPTSYASTKRRRSVATRSRRRSVSRRRNPSTGSLVSNAIGLAAGITAVGLAQTFVPPIGGVSPFATAGRQAATGYLLGLGMEKLNVMRAYANDVKLAGFALGVGTLINAFILPTISGFLRPAPKAQANNGMQGIGVVPAIPPYINAAPVNSGSGVNGIGVYSTPGAAFRR